MAYYPLSRCGLLAILLSVVALREGEDAPVSLLQVDFTTRPWAFNLTAMLGHERDAMLEYNSKNSASAAVLHIPYGHIALDIKYHNVGEQIITFPQRRPREFNVILATFKTWAADAIVQLGERRPGNEWKFDYNRSAAFALFGLMYIGIAQWFLYVSLLTWLFPGAMVFANSPLEEKLRDQTGMIDMVGQVAVDTFVFQALIYFPVFYMIKGVMQGKETVVKGLKTGLGKYRENWIADNLAGCALWIPADVVIFACPMYLRMPMEHCVSFGWTMFISAMRGAQEKPEPKFEP